MHGGEQRRALHQLVAGERVQATLRRTAARVVRASDPLEERRDVAGRPDLAHELDGADVDPELERRGGDERLQVAGTQPRLDAVSAVLREAAVVRGDDVVTESLAELVRQALGETAGVHEDERRPVLADEVGDPVEHVGHLFVGGDRFELALGQFEREVEVALVARVDDRRQRPIPHEQTRHGLDRSLRRGQADPARPTVAQHFETFQREREVRTPLVACDGVDLVDDHGVDRAQHLAALLGGHEQIERLGRRHDEAGRVPEHRRTLGTGGVAGAHRDTDRRRVEPELGCHRGDLRQRTFEVLGDVDRERLERRDVDDPGDVGDVVTRGVLAVQPVDRDEEPGEGLARSGRCRDQRVDTASDRRPPVRLRGRRAVGESSGGTTRRRQDGIPPARRVPAPGRGW